MSAPRGEAPARRAKLGEIAHARSGDKGAASNVGVVADSPEAFAWLRQTLTPERVAAHFRGLVRGRVERFEVPNLRALNFLLHDSLGGGGTESLKTDAQGKTHAQGLLEMWLEVPHDVLASVARSHRGRRNDPAG